VKNRLFYVAFTLLIAVNSYSQSVVNVTSITGWPSTVLIDSAYSFSVTVAYVSGVQPSFTAENLRLKYITDKMVANDIDAENFGPPEDVFFTLGNSFEIEVDDFTFDSTNFRQGGNIVVIWPSFVGGISNDSLETMVDGVFADSVNLLMKMPSIDNQSAWLNGELNWTLLESFGAERGYVIAADGKVRDTVEPNYKLFLKDLPYGLHYLVFPTRYGRVLVFKEIKN
jgi:hypothetical protein